MNMIDRKSRMVSFRLSSEEHRLLCEACVAHGVRSLSELARTALQGLIVTNGPDLPLHLQVQELRDRLATLSQQIERLSQSAEPLHTSVASAGD